MTAVRARCARCLRAPAGCVCRFIAPRPSPVELLILQSPLEVHHAKNSGRLLHLCLAGSVLEVGEDYDADRLRALLHAPWPGGRDGAPYPVLLYPDIVHDPGLGVLAAPPLDDAAARSPRVRLVVLDATWRKSRRMLYRHRLLQALPRLGLEGGAGRYLIRKAHAPDQLSTFEAVCAALARLGHADGQAALLAAFDGFVAQQRAFIPAPAGRG